MSTDENAQHESSIGVHKSQAAVDQSTEQQVARHQQIEQLQDGEGLTRSEGQKMRCVLLIPCCEAVHGRFPLNGTYFQTNEVFLDFSTLQQPIMVSPYKELAMQILKRPVTSVHCHLNSASFYLRIHGGERSETIAVGINVPVQP